jgi:signal transduction histidine kinase
MRKAPVIAAGALILLPTAFALWMGWRALESDRAGARANVARAFESRLADLRARVDGFAKEAESGFLDQTESLGSDQAALRAFSSSSPLARQAFYLKDGSFLFPPRFDGSASESDFYARAPGMLGAGPLDKESGDELRRGKPESGWRTWFHGQGQSFAFWRTSREGGIVGLELNSAAFLSRLAGSMPDDSAIASGSGAPVAASPRFALVDARGEDFLVWGDYEPAKGEKPVATLSLEEPFSGWELQSYSSESGLEGMARAESWLMIVACIALAAVMGGSVLALTRGFRVELAEARQRVSFVNQVSHELKTPLTNIRLYLDLLRTARPRPEQREKAYLDVISSESERLTRLIHNVLSFARKDRRDAPRPRELDWDETVAESLECFKPAFLEKGIELSFEPHGSGTACVDPDWARQIIGNLVSNAEKYAAGGKLVRVESGSRDGLVWARVRDSGPGIPRGEAERAFKPFVRLSRAVDEGASGSGLGLPISRDLARAHGGDILLENPGGPGASFLMTLRDMKGRSCVS